MRCIKQGTFTVFNRKPKPYRLHSSFVRPRRDNGGILYSGDVDDESPRRFFRKSTVDHGAKTPSVMKQEREYCVIRKESLV